MDNRKYTYVAYTDGIRKQCDSQSMLYRKFRPVVNMFDFDGVTREGNHPSPGDVIITGRTFEEFEIVVEYLKKHHLMVPVYFNPVHLRDRGNHCDAARQHSGMHKVKIIQLLKDNEVNIGKFHEDDPIQAELIKAHHPDVEVVKYPFDHKNNEDDK